MPFPLNLEQLCTEVCNIARTTGAFIKSQVGQVDGEDIISKNTNDFVSYVDQQAEQQLIKALSPLIPKALFLAEEATSAHTEPLTQHDVHPLTTPRWIIDPLDGTTNFLHNMPAFAVSIGLQLQGEIILGVVYEIARDECFYAWKGGGAYLNKKSIQVSTSVSKLADSFLAVGIPYYNYIDVFPQYIDLLQHLLSTCVGMRRLGAASVDMCYTACGRFDGFYEYKLSPWDVAAGSIIVQEAGGSVSDFSTGDNYLFGKQIICSTPKIYDALQATIAKYI